ncbi:3393_t:CDS:10 [Diversispora eburnea]|uniref:3393_t:CDS:1 n=1 Tax=Diversispora eburnea TaxID=1213867 RepID=A0A9N8VH97_9GLOM|nr:3393_t:CDS:10 [Diversispora eburnea]
MPSEKVVSGDIEFSPKLAFYLNGTRIEINNPDPDTTLLQYVRSIGLTGTKLGCAEGGCGACTVMISSYDLKSRKISHYSVNACLLPLCSVEGKHVITIEGIGNVKYPHPVQLYYMGIAMSLYVLLRNNPNPTEEEIEECFDGNLCRCTGYRPILDAAKTFAKPSSGQNNYKDDDETIVNGDLKNVTCGRADCCKLRIDTNGKIGKYDPSQELIFPPLLMNHVPVALCFSGRKTMWFRPINLNQLFYLKSKYPEAKLISGNTEVGIETKFKKMDYNVRIFVGDILELKTWEFQENGLLIGANVSLTKFQTILQDACKHYKSYQTQVFKALLFNLRWFAGNQIRNVATPAGNIVTGSPISDLNPIFLSTRTKFILTSSSKNSRDIPATSFWTGYRQNCLDKIEILEKIFIPCSKLGQYVRAYKQAKRRDDDIAIVNSGLSIILDEKNIVQEASFAFGGMSGLSVRAPISENFVLGKFWGDENIFMGLLNKLSEELQLSFSSPGGMIAYRKSLVSGFMYKFWHDVSKCVGIQTSVSDEEVENFVGIIERQVSKGVQLIGQPEEDKKIVGKSIPAISALKQVTGEAIYVDDLPKQHGELYGALVLSQKAHAKIIKIDASIALEKSGVKGFFTAKDVPGDNKWGAVFQDEEIFASEEVHWQVIGLIVADTQAIAQEATNLVKIEYEVLPHILTIEEAIEKNSFYHIERRLSTGDVEKGFQEADLIFEETNAALVIPKPEDNEFEIHSSSQAPTAVQKDCASVLGIAANKVVCRVKRIGGGFGGKETRSIPLPLVLAVGAWHLKKPIRCMLDRDEDIIISGQRHPYLGRWKVGVSKEGKLLAYDLQLYGNMGWSCDLSLGVLERAITHVDNCYYCPNVRIIGKLCKTNIHSNTAFRGFGAPQGMMITENMMSEISDRLGIDPIETREKNYYLEGQKTHFNQILRDWHIPALHQQVMELSDYVNRRKKVDDFNSKNKWRKRGLTLIPTKFGLSFTVLHLNQAAALVHIYTDGSVLVSHVHLMETATNLVINTSPTAASVSSDINGFAVFNACQTLSERLKPYREKMPGKSFKEIVLAAYLDRVNLSVNGFYKTPDINHNWDKNEGQAFYYFTTGVACTEVEVDILTGDHTIIRTDLVMDIGRSLNYAIDVGQIEGAFVQGVGWCTMEETLHFPTGHIFTKGPGNYKIPGFRDIPQDFRIYTFDGKYSNLKTIHSSKGVGEPPLFLGSSVFFAIRDAIKAFRLTNNNHKAVTLCSPATPERIRLACEDEFVKKAHVRKKDGEKEWILAV